MFVAFKTPNTQLRLHTESMPNILKLDLRIEDTHTHSRAYKMHRNNSDNCKPSERDGPCKTTREKPIMQRRENWRHYFRFNHLCVQRHYLHTFPFDMHLFLHLFVFCCSFHSSYAVCKCACVSLVVNARHGLVCADAWRWFYALLQLLIGKIYWKCLFTQISINWLNHLHSCSSSILTVRLWCFVLFFTSISSCYDGIHRFEFEDASFSCWFFSCLFLKLRISTSSCVCLFSLGWLCLDDALSHGWESISSYCDRFSFV